MACPHAAGIATLLFQVNPKFTPQNIREVMMKTLRFVDVNGNSINTPAWNASYGFGRLDAYAAVKAALGTVNRTLFSAGFNAVQLASTSVMMDSKLVDIEDQVYGVSDITEPYSTDIAKWSVVK